MTRVFADTSYFIALVNPDDDAYESARTYTLALDRRMFTTAWVLTEVASHLAEPANRGLFLELLADLRADSRVTIIPPSQDLFDQGVGLYRDRSDKSWSLVDCISFVVMRKHNIVEALTGDHHFEQAGFQALLSTH